MVHNIAYNIIIINKLNLFLNANTKEYRPRNTHLYLHYVLVKERARV